MSHESEMRKLRPLVRARSQGICEAQTPACMGRAVHVHHKKLRSQGGKTEMDNLLDCCLACHGHIHANPSVSYEAGWLTSRRAG